MAEETGLQILSLGRLVGVYSQAERDPRFHAVCVALEAHVDGDFDVYDKAEVLEVRSFSIDRLPQEPLAHDHKQQLQDYLEGKTVLA